MTTPGHVLPLDWVANDRLPDSIRAAMARQWQESIRAYFAAMVELIGECGGEADMNANTESGTEAA